MAKDKQFEAGSVKPVSGAIQTKGYSAEVRNNVGVVVVEVAGLEKTLVDIAARAVASALNKAAGL